MPSKQQDAALSFKSRQDVEFERRQNRFIMRRYNLSQLFWVRPYFMKLVRKLPVDIMNYAGKANLNQLAQCVNLNHPKPVKHLLDHKSYQCSVLSYYTVRNEIIRNEYTADRGILNQIKYIFKAKVSSLKIPGNGTFLLKLCFLY